MPFDRATFYATLRHGALFDHGLSQRQVDGTEAILDAWDRSGFTDERWLAYMLATAYHETGRSMSPVREGGHGKGHPYGKAAANGQIYYGRGDVQITWQKNYERADKALGLGGTLVANADRALDPGIAAQIMIRGMTEGWFTDFKLADYLNDHLADYLHARRIVNGLDKAETIAGYALVFFGAITAAMRGADPVLPTSKGPSSSDAGHHSNPLELKGYRPSSSSEVTTPAVPPDVIADLMKGLSQVAHDVASTDATSAPSSAPAGDPQPTAESSIMPQSPLVAAHPHVAAAIPGVDFFQGAINFGENILHNLTAGAAAIANPALPGVTGQPGSGFFGTIDNVKRASAKIGEIIADAKKSDVQEAVADGVDFLKLIFATLDTFHIDVPGLGLLVASLGSMHAGGTDKPAA